jgi:hypothetical protein
MTLTYVRNGDGYTVHSRERAVCVVHTKTSEYLPARQAPDGRALPGEVVDKHLAQGDWQFHFYHGFFTPTMLKELLDLLPKAEPDHGRGPVFLPGAPAAYPEEKQAPRDRDAAVQEERRRTHENFARNAGNAAPTPHVSAMEAEDADLRSAKVADAKALKAAPDGRMLPVSALEKENARRRRPELEAELGRLHKLIHPDSDPDAHEESVGEYDYEPLEKPAPPPKRVDDPAIGPGPREF